MHCIVLAAAIVLSVVYGRAVLAMGLDIEPPQFVDEQDYLAKLEEKFRAKFPDLTRFDPVANKDNLIEA